MSSLTDIIYSEASKIIIFFRKIKLLFSVHYPFGKYLMQSVLTYAADLTLFSSDHRNVLSENEFGYLDLLGYPKLRTDASSGESVLGNLMTFHTFAFYSSSVPCIFKQITWFMCILLKRLLAMNMVMVSGMNRVKGFLLTYLKMW
jgi:hypothetical protein